MSRLTPAERNRLLELLADEMLGMLDGADAAELATLRRRDDAHEVTYDDVIGALLLAADDPSEGDLPADVAARLKRAGAMMVSDSSSMPVDEARRPSGVTTALAWAGWLAAAAGFILAATLWFTPTPTTPVIPTPAGPTLAQKVDDLVHEPDTVVVAFAGQGPIAERKNVGDIVWNERLQRGFMRLRELDTNDPARSQYQLWIFDKTRETYPVDGGVFDVALSQPTDSEGRRIIPFEPALPVGDPAAFAVTIEQPGGVVVTDKKGLVLLGPVGG